MSRRTTLLALVLAALVGCVRSIDLFEPTPDAAGADRDAPADPDAAFFPDAAAFFPDAAPFFPDAAAFVPDAGFFPDAAPPDA
jgi:hypothetical protein